MTYTLFHMKDLTFSFMFSLVHKSKHRLHHFGKLFTLLVNCLRTLSNTADNLIKINVNHPMIVNHPTKTSAIYPLSVIDSPNQSLSTDSLALRYFRLENLTSHSPPIELYATQTVQEQFILLSSAYAGCRPTKNVDHCSLAAP